MTNHSYSVEVQRNFLEKTTRFKPKIGGEEAGERDRILAEE